MHDTLRKSLSLQPLQGVGHGADVLFFISFHLKKSDLLSFRVDDHISDIAYSQEVYSRFSIGGRLLQDTRASMILKLVGR